MKIKTYSYDDHFPDHHPAEGEPFIRCYVGDFCYREKVVPGNIAIMFEPRSIEPRGFEFVDRHPDMFKYIFTHDSKLLRLPNARFFLWCSIWCKADVEKTKGISLIATHKRLCELHEARAKLARYFDANGLVDCYGTYKDPLGKEGWVDSYTAHAEYKFAIAIENYIDDCWFTEKILNCFSTKTVPIYVGARKINEFFNADGIIQVSDWKDIPELVRNLDIDAEYEKRKVAIEDNYERVKPYGVNWRDRFFDKYGDLLEEMYDDYQQ